MNPLMLPPAPKDVGRLSNVFSSALASISGEVDNSLRLPRVDHSLVILIDGLGYENLKSAKGYARFLNSVPAESIRCEFPSTTATSLAGLATGARSSQHGVLGYSVYDRASRKAMNLLNGWANRGEARKFMNMPSLSEVTSSPKVRVIGPSVYQDSGFTELTMTGAEYLPEDSISGRLARALRVPAEKSLTYLYIPELDQLAHRFGVASTDWLNELESIDGLLAKFTFDLPAAFGVLITADHGVLDVPSTAQVMLDDFDWYVNAVEHTAGDPRCNFVYLRGEASLDELRASLVRNFGSDAYICNASELKESGWADWTTPAASPLVPDLLIIWQAKMVGYDRRFAKPTHLKMVGQHGAISDVETRIPLIRLGSY
jgi:predicted AlkP superfamily pyrophosphatase or phosphodiesterase